MKRKQARIGIFVGAFDPVHAGHIAFALDAAEAAELDEVVFLPERRPRLQSAPEHYAHRVAMLRTALSPHRRLSVLEVADGHFTAHRTVPQLRRLFSRAELVFLLGADAVSEVAHLPYMDKVFSTAGLVISVRSKSHSPAVETYLGQLRLRPQTLQILCNHGADISSLKVRQALRTGRYTAGLLASVRRYARQEWLYASPGYFMYKNA